MKASDPHQPIRQAPQAWATTLRCVFDSEGLLTPRVIHTKADSVLPAQRGNRIAAVPFIVGPNKLLLTSNLKSTKKDSTDGESNIAQVERRHAEFE